MVRTTFLVVNVLFLLASIALGQASFNGPESVAFDTVTDRYFVSNYYDGTIVQIDRYGQRSYFKTGLSHCYGNCIKDNVLYVTVPGKVVGYDLTSGEEVFEVNISTITNLDGLTTDTSGYLYALDTGGRLHKIDIEQQTASILVNGGFPSHPQDIIFDKWHNRILIAAYDGTPYLKAVNLDDGILYDAVTPPTGYFDGISIDNEGYVYLGSHASNGLVYRLDSTLTVPEILSNSYRQPAGLDYNLRDNILAVPNFSGNNVGFIVMYIDFMANFLWGPGPHEVSFLGLPEITVNEWHWDFGDGDTSMAASPTHVYDEPGLYDVTLEIVPAEGPNRSYTRRGYIAVLADTLSGDNAEGNTESEIIEVPLYAGNNMPLYGMQIPVEYGGAADLRFEGFSVEGCLSAAFAEITYLDYDSAGKRFTLDMEVGPSLYMSPSESPLIILQFSIDDGDSGDVNTLFLDGYDTYLPVYHGVYTDYTPATKAPSVTCTKAGCCTGTVGNVNCSEEEQPDITDITRLIDFLYLSHAELCCLEEADANSSGGEPDIADITALISHLYISHDPLGECP